MSCARYYVEALGSGGLCFEYTYYHVAPAFFLARKPTNQEKLELVDVLRAKYNPVTLSAHRFGCVRCGRPANGFLDYPTYALLYGSTAFAVNNVLVAVCQASECHATGYALLEVIKTRKARSFGLSSVGPEMLNCQSCFKLQERRYQRCERCRGPSYCSVDCQKTNWRQHKPFCISRVEAKKLSLGELAQRDQDACDFTHGTGELSHMNHSGQFSETEEKLGLNANTVGIGADAAKQRYRVWRRSQHNLDSQTENTKL